MDNMDFLMTQTKFLASRVPKYTS